MGNRASLKDIAAVVGVTAATVSLVLNGKDKNGRVSKEIADKVRKAAERMHYQPNRLAVSLQSGSSRTIGLLVAEISNSFYGWMAYYVQKEVESLGYDVIIMNTDENADQMGKMIDLMNGRQVDGFIIVPAQGGEKYVQRLLKANKPLVLVDRYYPSLKTYNVLLDNCKAAFDATDYLIEAGCGRIALFVYESGQPQMLGRVEGYAKALRARNMYDETLLIRVRFKYLQEDIEAAVGSLFRNEAKADGLVFATNTIAGLAFRQLFCLNVNVGTDVLITSFDLKDVSGFLPHFIPYISQPIAGIAETAADLVIRQIEGKQTECGMTTQLEGPLIIE